MPTATNAPAARPEDSSSFLGEPIWTVECKPANDHIYDRILVKIHSNSNANTVLRKLTNQTISWSMRERMVLRLIRGMHLLMQTPPSARREALENTQNVTRACYELRSMETIASSSSDDNAPFCHGYEDFSGKVWKAKELETAIVTIAELCDGRRAPSGIEGALWSKLFRFFAPHMNKRHFILEWCLPKGASFLINDIHDFRRYFRLRMDTAGNTEGVTLRALIFEDT